MDINHASLSATFTTFKQIFDKNYEATPTWSDKMATRVPSTARDQTYGWLAKIPAFRKWVGERIMANAAQHAYSLVNDKYELTVAVKREDFEDDQLGTYSALLVPQLGVQAKKFPDFLVAAALQAGKTGLCFDGKPFFAADHYVSKAKGTGAQANLFTGTPLTNANFEAKFAAMMAFQGDDAKSLLITPTHLFVPPQLRAAGLRVVKSQIVATAAGTASETNINEGSVEVVVLPELANEPLAWYLADCSKPIKPLIFQDRQAPTFQYRWNENDDNVFDRDEYVMGGRARGAAGYGLWFQMIRCEG